MFFVETGAHYTGQPGFDHLILLFQPSKCWYSRFLPLAHRACPKAPLLSVNSPSGANLPERFLGSLL